jgi:LytS/YehU family sensor histidine kinase
VGRAAQSGKPSECVAFNPSVESAVPFSTMLVELAEKMGLLAAAALLVVLVPPLRARLLATGPVRGRRTAAAIFGLLLSIWGAMLGLEVSGEHFNVRAIGVLLAAFLGGPLAGLAAGSGAGIFYALQVDEATAPWVLLASILDGVIAGLIAQRRPELTREPIRAAGVALVVQSFHILLVGAGLLLTSQAQRYIPAWPAHVAKLAVNAAGVGLFVAVARLIVSQQESAVALAKAQADAQVAALQALRRRLEPHFLFNALNAVRATIRRDPDKARELVADLSDLYRYLLTHPEDAELGAEVEHAASYLAIERVRLGEERVNVVLEVGDDAKRVRVPSLLIQPLVENAVKHGLARHEGAGTITVRASLDASVLVIEVRDESAGARVPPLAEPQPQRGEPTGEGTHVALVTLRERLARRFGAQASLTLTQREHGASQIIRIPILDAASASSAASSGESAAPAPPLTGTRRESA